MQWNKLTPEQKNALVAEKVMGLRIHRYPAQQYETLHFPETAVLIDEEDCIIGNPVNYTTDMNLAWDVLKHIEEQDELHSTFAYHLHATFATPEGFDIFQINLAQLASLTPESMCKAALRAVGVAIEDEAIA